MLNLATSGEGTLQYKFVMQTCSLMNWPEECPAVHLAAEQHIARVCCAIGSQSFADTFKTDLLADGKALILDGPSKRRRLDADLARAISGKALAEGRARTTGAFLRANVALGAGGERVLDMKYCTSYQASMHLSFAKTEALCINWDGVRSGNPMVENILLFLGDIDTQQFGWGLPLEIGWGSTHYTSHSSHIVS